MRVACVQLALGSDRGSNEERCLEAMEAAKRKGADIVVFPEMSWLCFFPAHSADPQFFDWAEPIPGPTVSRFQEQARRLELVTVPNLYERAGAGRYYDASPVIDADGSLLGVTRMAHIAEEPGFHEKFYYWPGDTPPRVYETRAGRIGIAICYDRHYPELTRSLALLGAELILIPTACLVGEEFDMYEVEVQAASFSSQVFMAFCNRTGDEGPRRFGGRSFVTGPGGSVLTRAGEGEEILVADCDASEIERIRQKRYYLRDRRPELYTPLCQVLAHQEEG